VRPASGEEDAFPRLYLERFLSNIYDELSLEDVEKFVLTRVHMRRRFTPGR
jgi:hypothetical protein